MEMPAGAGIVNVGGEGGIRTRGGLLAPTRFPGVRLKPLIHLSEAHEFTTAPTSLRSCPPRGRLARGPAKPVPRRVARWRTALRACSSSVLIKVSGGGP